MFFASCDSLLPYPFPPNISMFDALREDFFQKSPKMGAEAPAVSNEQVRIHSALVVLSVMLVGCHKKHFVDMCVLPCKYVTFGLQVQQSALEVGNLRLDSKFEQVNCDG